MSHVVCSKIIITDLGILKKAVARLGGLKWSKKKTFEWYGRWMKDYSAHNAAYRNGIDADQYGTCDACIQMSGVSFEIGVVRRKDNQGWSLVWDNYGSGQALSKHIGNNGEKLMAAYSEEYIRQFAEQQGFLMEEQIDDEGNLVLTMSAN
jgi:hypothetical protein